MVKVAVVTGSNKGIGLAIVKGLCKQFDGDVYLTSRDVSRGQEAVDALKAEGMNPKFHQLDIEDKDSIQRLKQHLQETYGGVDVLVNNAGFAFKQAATEPFAVQAEVSLGINYFGTLNLINALMPLMNAGSRIANVSSFVSSWTIKKCSPELRAKLLALTTQEDISNAMKEFVSSAKDGTATKKGWPESSYGTSKVGVSLLTPVLQAELSADASRPDRIINACCPGYVKTDMSGNSGGRPVEEGADSAIYLSLLPPNTQHPKGEFVSERKIVDWPTDWFKF